MDTRDQAIDVTTAGSEWKILYRVGGVAALIAAVLFRRNLGVEISLFAAQKQPGTIEEWFALLQTNRLLGLAYLNFFDLVNCALAGLMLLALYVLLRQTNRSCMAIAAALGLAGIIVYFSSNTALTTLGLSEQYAASTTDAQRSMLLAAGQATVAMNRFTTPGAYPGAGGYMSLLLIAVADMITSVVMLRSHLFSRLTAYVGVFAGALDLAYCVAILVAPAAARELLGLAFIPLAGLLLMIWHIMVGWRLYQLGRVEGKTLPQES